MVSGLPFSLVTLVSDAERSHVREPRRADMIRVQSVSIAITLRDC
jgi:hypothetical protein